MKISVVGAGPAGCITALNGFEDHDITLYEEHKTQPVQCAGLVSKSGLERLNIPLKKSVIKNEVRGAVIVSPSGYSFRIDGGETKAYVINRSEFDHFLLDTVVDYDVDFVNKKVTDLGGLDADRIVLATGTDYYLQRRFNLDVPKNFLVGAQYEVDLECDRGFVELHFNVPDFFSWIIPLEDHARVGCCSVQNPLPYLNSFLERLRKDGRIRKPGIRDRNFGIIPIYDPKLRTDYGRIITVGDAAGQVKASTGGGIVMGGIAARFAHQPDYWRRWRSEIGRELYLHLKISRFINRLSYEKRDKLFSLVKEHRWILEEKGDMDIASKVLSGLFKNPKFTLKFIHQLPGYILDML